MKGYVGVQYTDRNIYSRCDTEIVNLIAIQWYSTVIFAADNDYRTFCCDRFGG